MRMGKSLIFIGCIFILAGILLTIDHRIPWLGKLPGDIIIRKDTFSFYFPLTTCLLVSIILTLVLYLLRR